MRAAAGHGWGPGGVAPPVPGGAVGWIFGLVYLVLPGVAAIFVSQKGGEGYLREDGPRVTGWLRWLVAFYAYLGILSDRFPSEKTEEIVRFEVQTGRAPTAGVGLVRRVLRS